MEHTIVCQRCGKGFAIADFRLVRRKYCDECRAIVLRESGERTGPLAQRHKKVAQV